MVAIPTGVTKAHAFPWNFMATSPLKTEASNPITTTLNIFVNIPTGIAIIRKAILKGYDLRNMYANAKLIAKVEIVVLMPLHDS